MAVGVLGGHAPAQVHVEELQPQRLDPSAQLREDDATTSSRSACISQKVLLMIRALDSQGGTSNQFLLVGRRYG